MEARMIASLLMQPSLLLLLALIVCASVVLGGAPSGTAGRLSRWQLLRGHVGAALVGLTMAAAFSYVSREEAVTVWHVSAANYWEVITREFVNNATLIVRSAGVGISVVGIPIVLALVSRGLGTAPWVMLASVAISIVSLAASALVLLLPSHAHIPHVLDLVFLVVGTHLALSLGFCVRAKLPWTFMRRTYEIEPDERMQVRFHTSGATAFGKHECAQRVGLILPTFGGRTERSILLRKGVFHGTETSQAVHA
jgi:hypothetical protein